MELGKLKKPNLFIIGNQKSGTTALYHFLRAHPDIFFPEIKEPFYFAQDLLKERKEKGMEIPHYSQKEGYEKLYKKAGNKEVIGDASTVYLFSEVAAENIYEFNKDAKIVLILREIVDYLSSLHAQNTISNGEDKDFETALNLEDSRRKGENLPKFYNYKSYFYYSEWTKYAEHIKRYLDLFPKENIKILFYEDFKNDNNGVVKEILDFLDINTSFVPEVREYNQTMNIKFQKLKFFVENNFSFVKTCMPYFIHNLLSKAFLKLVSGKKGKPKVDEELRKKLMKKYKCEVVKLGKLIDKDVVKKWGYEK